jgi:hypothetical protein
MIKNTMKALPGSSILILKELYTYLKGKQQIKLQSKQRRFGSQTGRGNGRSGGRKSQRGSSTIDNKSLWEQEQTNMLARTDQLF